MNCDVPELWIEHKDALRNFILKRVHDQEDTDDIMQDVLMKVYNFCTHKSGVNNIRSWLFRIAQNTIIDRTRKKQPVRLSEEHDVIIENENDAYQEAVDYMLPIINLLPPEYAEPIRLSDIEGMKQAEVAERLNLGLSATKSRIQRGRLMLKDIFVECCIMETSADGKLISFDIKTGCKPLQAHKRTLKTL